MAAMGRPCWKDMRLLAGISEERCTQLLGKWLVESEQTVGFLIGFAVVASTFSSEETGSYISGASALLLPDLAGWRAFVTISFAHNSYGFGCFIVRLKPFNELQIS